jgi:hypothetical protein
MVLKFHFGTASFSQSFANQIHQNYVSKLHNSTLIQKTKIPKSLSQTTASNDSNVKVSFSEGR